MTPVHDQLGPPSFLPHEVYSLDDLSVSDLVTGGRFGRHVAGALSTARRPSIFRRCYSSETRVPTWYSPAAPSNTAALADCLPPYYWQAKHMQKLIRVCKSFFSSRIRECGSPVLLFISIRWRVESLGFSRKFFHLLFWSMET